MATAALPAVSARGVTLFRGLFLDKLRAAYRAGALAFFGKHAPLIDPRAFAAYLAPLWDTKWVLYCKHPFGGPKEVLRYLARYTHRVAISNRRLIASDENGVTFKWKDYRIEGPERYKVMTLPTHEFIRRFLMHVLPAGFHRIRYYGLLASGKRSRASANCSRRQSFPSMPSRQSPPMLPKRKRQSTHALAAAAA